MKEYLLFDLDGTLTDPKIGITTCVQYALKSFGIEEPDLDKLEPFIGPPLKDSFMQFYNMSDEQAQAAVEKYRERFQDIGLFENRVYVGIPQMLSILQANGMHLAVASSKPTVYVERILEHFHMKQYFEVIVGSELDGRRVNKDEVVQEALRQLFKDKPIASDKVYMIGDRKFDVEGAKALKIESVGVSYGYGSVEELKEAQADYIVRSVPELQSVLLREFCERKPKGFFEVMWPFLYPLLIFILVKQVVGNALMIGMQELGKILTGTVAQWLFTYSETTGELEGLTGNAGAIMNAITFAVAAAFIWSSAKPQIAKAKEDMYVTHLRPESILSYLGLGMATVGTVVGINILLELLGVTTKVEGYRAMINDPYSAGLGIGLITTGVIVPIAEELLFGGVIFNVFKRRTKLQFAILISAFAYGLYHMNYMQGVYAFVIGCLIMYAYEYFGTFFMAVFVHVMSSVLVYLISYTAMVETALYSLPMLILFVVVAVVGIKLLSKEKKII